jgi:hypothetical protein
MSANFEGYIGIGEGTFFIKNNESLVLIQKIKLHLIVTTILIGIILSFWFSFYPALVISFIGLLEFFVRIKITIKMPSQSLSKDLYLSSWKIFSLYNINNLDNFTLTEYETGRGEASTITSYDIGFSNSGKKRSC